MKKYITLVASIIIMLSIGGVYAWSMFVHPLTTKYNLTTVQTQIVFGLTIAVFSFSMIFAGKTEKKYGAKVSTFIGMILFVAGYLIASQSNGSFVLILTGIGIISGVGLSVTSQLLFLL